jgi:hypothetical protein
MPLSCESFFINGQIISNRPQLSDVLDDKHFASHLATLHCTLPSRTPLPGLHRLASPNGPSSLCNQYLSNFLASLLHLRISPKTKNFSPMPQRPQLRLKDRVKWCTGENVLLKSTRETTRRHPQMSTAYAMGKARWRRVPAFGSVGRTDG